MRRTIGTSPVMVAFRNERRAVLTVEMLPNSIAAGNTGLIYGKFGSAPQASLSSPTWDFVLNSGATAGTNVYQNRDKALIVQDLWIVSDTADQEINVIELEAPEEPAAA